MDNKEFDPRELNDALLTDKEQDHYFPLSEEDKKVWQTWVPKGYKITNMLIYEAIKRGIPKPNGNKEHDQEYIQFLNEHVLTVEKEEEKPVIIADERKKKKSNLIDSLKEWLKIRKKDLKTNDIESIDDKIINNEITKLETEPDLNVEELRKKALENLSERIEELEKEYEINKKKKKTEPIPIEINEEIKKAIEEELEKDEESIYAKIVERRKTIAIPFIIAALLALITSMFRYKDEKEREKIATKALDYVLEEKISYEDAIKKATSDIKIGDKHFIYEGEYLNTHSMMSGDKNFPGVTKEMGKEFSDENKYEGLYPITGFSIVRNSDNKILAYVEDFYSPSKDTRLSSFIDETLSNTNVSYEDIRVEMHYGRTDYKNGEFSRLGWKNESPEIEKEVQSIINKAAVYKDTIKNFSGNTITIEKKDGTVVIPIKDGNGNLYKPGDIVVGSDNNQYEITELSLDEQVMYNEQENDEKQLTFSVKNANILAAAPFLAAAVADYMIKKKKNKEAAKNPYYKEIEPEEVNDYINEFHDNKQPLTKQHLGELISSKQLEEEVINAYYEITGIVEDINNLNYKLVDNKIIISHKNIPEKEYDATNYINQHLNSGESIGTGWDPDAEEYFDKKGAR